MLVLFLSLQTCIEKIKTRGSKRKVPFSFLIDSSCSHCLLRIILSSSEPPAPLNFLQLCVILEPMQELMSRHKTYNLSPRDCLKTCLFQKWQRMVAPPGTTTVFTLFQLHFLGLLLGTGRCEEEGSDHKFIRKRSSPGAR